MSKHALCLGRQQNGRLTITLAPTVKKRPFFLTASHPNGTNCASSHGSMPAAIEAAYNWHNQGHTNIAIRDLRGGDAVRPFEKPETE